MAKKYYKLEYLESFVGKKFMTKDGEMHFLITGLANNKYGTRTFDTQLSGCSAYSWIPLDPTNSNASINVGVLLRDWFLATEAAEVLYGQKNKK